MKYYCVGIKGAGMGTLANILKDLGNEVSGYDDDTHYKYTEDGLNKRNIKIYYDGSASLDKDTIVTYSKAFKPEHKEMKRLKELGLKFKEYNEVVGDLTKQFETISVCGTHGKTTTTLLISELLESVGCNYFVGDGSGYADKDNSLFVIESDEYNKHLLAYHPYLAVLTSIELDHTECYEGGLEEIKETFKTFCNKAKRVLACGDYEAIRDLNLDCVYYGINENNFVRAENIEYKENGTEFDYYEGDDLIHHFDIPVFGKYMVLNVLAGIYTARSYNVSLEKIEEVLKNFKGAKRRFKSEVIKDYVIISDYAHHPTAIKLTLEAVKQKYPNKESVAIFLPNTYSRTEALLNEFVESLENCDKAYVLDIRANREKQEDYPGITSDLIIKENDKYEKIAIDDADKLLKHKGAVLTFMSCGDIYLLEEALKKKLNDE